MCPPKPSKTWIFWILWFSAGTFTAPTGGTVGVSRYHLLRLYMRHDKKIKTKTIPKTLIFSMKIFFERFWKIKKFKKSLFRKFSKIRKFQKVNFFGKCLKGFCLFLQNSWPENDEIIEKSTFFIFFENIILMLFFMFLIDFSMPGGFSVGFETTFKILRQPSTFRNFQIFEKNENFENLIFLVFKIFEIWETYFGQEGCLHW